MSLLLVVAEGAAGVDGDHRLVAVRLRRDTTWPIGAVLPAPGDGRDRAAHRPAIPTGETGTGGARIRKGERYSIRECQDRPRLLRRP